MKLNLPTAGALVLFTLSFSCQANRNPDRESGFEKDLQGSRSYTQAPPSFSIGKTQAVFVDFKTANYSISYDSKTQIARASSSIRFSQSARGRMLFDLVPSVVSAELDGIRVEVTEIELPGKTSRMKVLSTVSEPGEHTLTVKNLVTQFVEFDSEGVRSAFWTSDLDDRQFMEQFLPANLEYDQLSVSLQIEFLNGKSPQKIFTNGIVESLGASRFRIAYPPYFNTASVYFHTAPEGHFSVEESTYTSSDGRVLPITAYARSRDVAQDAVRKGKAELQDLESTFGPWPHPQLLIYAGYMGGGMEYAGATMTDLQVLGHEMCHSYHARGLMPSSGDDGWMDEAIAMWHDSAYALGSIPTYSNIKLSGRSPYIRTTPDAAYSEGEELMEYLGSEMGADSSGFKKFLRDYFQKYKYKTVTTEDFRLELERASGKSFATLFNHYVYAKDSSLEDLQKESQRPRLRNPVHPKFDKKILRKFL